jgi:phage tail sheath gpL-like
VRIPGVFVYLSLIGAAPTQAPLRVLFLSYKTSAGTAASGTLFRAQSEDEVITKCGTGSGLHRYFRAFAAQGGANVGAETWFMPVSAPSGTAQTKFIKVLEAPTGSVVGSTVNPVSAAAGFWSVWIAGKQYDSTIANGSSPATIMQDMVAQIQADQDFLPCTAAYSGGQIEEALIATDRGRVARLALAVRTEDCRPEMGRQPASMVRLDEQPVSERLFPLLPNVLADEQGQGLRREGFDGHSPLRAQIAMMLR